MAYHIDRPTTLVAALLTTAALHSSCATAFSAESTTRPNIIIILADDMGYSDIGCYGGEIETPTLNRLADNGLRFTQFYNTARCCPTRASLLTGLYPHQAGVGWMMSDNGHDGYRGNLNNNCLTIAEVLHTAGYSTYMAGKWHVTRHVDPKGPDFNWPLQRGFDRFYGTIHGAGSFYDPNTLMRGNTMISPAADPKYQPEQYYYTHAISDHAVRFINDHHESEDDRPFFMYVAYTAAHWPMHALEKDIAKYRGRYDGGYGATRSARYKRMKQMGLIDPAWELSPQAGDWDSVEHREWEIRCMEVYAAMVDSMDQGIGNIVSALKANQSLDNTLVFYLQDNGGCAETLGRQPRNGLTQRPLTPTLQPMKSDELQKDMIPKQTRDGFPTVMGPGIMPGPDGTYIAYGKGWANVSNTPFREYKHWVHEGGIGTPLIAHWPNGIKRRGEFDRQPGHLIDLMATCVDVAGATYPESYSDQPIKPLEGRSLKPAFAGDTIQRDAIYWEHEGNRAIRQGRWKLVAKGVNGPWELYDIHADRSEMHDLATSHPDRVKAMAAEWQSYAERANVLPLVPQWANRNKNTGFSKKKNFKLTHGDDLPRDKAPNVNGTGLRIDAKVTLDRPQGVIIAQGGDAHGYALLIDDGHVVFLVNRDGKISDIRTESKIASGSHSVAVLLAKDGTASITVDGSQAASGGVAGPCKAMPIDGLQVGEDKGGTVGDYGSDFALAGRVETVTVRIQR